MIEQGTQEWLQQRCGRITASRIVDVMAKTKSGYGASRKSYMTELLVERVTGVPTEHYVNAAMQWGTDQEPHAREEYAMRYGVDVEQTGYVAHPAMDFAGASPDGLVGYDGLVEIKCPATATHIETILNGKVPRKYLLQMQWQMACTASDWCDFVSYDPRINDARLNLYCTRVQRDNALIAEIESEVRKFEEELRLMEQELTAKMEADNG
jgi:putative phage-type endonuclease